MAGPLGERGGPVKRSLIWRKDLAESRGSLVMLSSPPEPPARRKNSAVQCTRASFSFISVKFGSDFETFYKYLALVFLWVFFSQ